MWTPKWFVGLGALLAFLVTTTGEERMAPGQLRAAPESAGKLKFEIYQDVAKEFRWRLKAANGAILATAGQGYKAKADCQKGVDRIKSEAASNKLTFEVYKDKANEYRWRLKAANGQVVAAASEGYKAKADCEEAIDLLKKGAAKAEVEDKT
jgi:uncharacterized protein YegP (UPF0339 family)